MDNLDAGQEVMLTKLKGSPDDKAGVLVEGYRLHGYLLEPLRVDSGMVIRRDMRNGVEALGLFTSSNVDAIVADTESEFKYKVFTRNSIWQVEVLNYDTPKGDT